MAESAVSSAVDTVVKNNAQDAPRSWLRRLHARSVRHAARAASQSSVQLASHVSSILRRRSLLQMKRHEKLKRLLRWAEQDLRLPPLPWDVQASRTGDDNRLWQLSRMTGRENRVHIGARPGAAPAPAAGPGRRRAPCVALLARCCACASASSNVPPRRCCERMPPRRPGDDAPPAAQTRVWRTR